MSSDFTHILALLSVDLLAPTDILDTKLEDAQADEAQEERCAGECHVALGEEPMDSQFSQQMVPGELVCHEWPNPLPRLQVGRNHGVWVTSIPLAESEQKACSMIS